MGTKTFTEFRPFLLANHKLIYHTPTYPDLVP
jgi:hypothetical protein